MQVLYLAPQLNNWLLNGILVYPTLLEKMGVTTLTELVLAWILFHGFCGFWLFPRSITKLPIHKI